MLHALYNAALTVAAPPAKGWLRRNARHAPLLERFSPTLPPFTAPPLWIQACSMGEINTVRPLLQMLHERYPSLPLLLTTSTVTGMEQARKQVSALAEVTWFPFDTPAAVRHFFERARPRALVLVETELWPNVLREAQRSKVPVVVVNARLSDRHFRRYKRYRRFFRPLFQRVALALVQTETYASRFETLGTPAEQIYVTRSMKFDSVATAVDTRERARLRALHDFAAEEQILLFGSTRPGDEALAAECWAELSPQLPRLRLVVAPRHVERAREVAGLFPAPVSFRSELLNGKGTRGARILMVDTTGELARFYSLATLAVVGGSFFPGVDGHNPLEPAALGVPTIFGPFMNNFSEPAAALLGAHGAVQVQRPGELVEALRRLLSDPGECRRLGTRGRMAVLENQGAVRRTVDALAQLLAL